MVACTAGSPSRPCKRRCCARHCSRWPPPSTKPPPARRGGCPGGPGPERMGAAFCEYIERYPTDRLPEAGGAAATVVVTIRLDQLQDALGAGVLDDNGRISATEARRLACEAAIIPAVLGGRRPGPRHRTPPQVPHRATTPRPGTARRRLHRRRLRLATRPLPRPSRHRLVPRRPHLGRQRAHALSQAPRTCPPPRLHHHPTRHRQAHLHQTHVRRAGPRGLWGGAAQ